MSHYKYIYRIVILINQYKWGYNKHELHRKCYKTPPAQSSTAGDAISIWYNSLFTALNTYSSDIKSVLLLFPHHSSSSNGCRDVFLGHGRSSFLLSRTSSSQESTELLQSLMKMCVCQSNAGRARWALFNSLIPNHWACTARGRLCVTKSHSEQSRPDVLYRKHRPPPKRSLASALQFQ